MCIRDSFSPGGDAHAAFAVHDYIKDEKNALSVDVRVYGICLLYTSDAADERSSVDLGGRRIIKKKNSIARCSPAPRNRKKN